MGDVLTAQISVTVFAAMRQNQLFRIEDRFPGIAMTVTRVDNNHFVPIQPANVRLSIEVYILDIAWRWFAKGKEIHL